MTLSSSIKICLQKYATFKGRASRSEYWWFYLVTFLAGAVLSMIDDTLCSICVLALLLPSISVAVRRMHDVGKSGWWIICPIYNIVCMLLESTPGTNEYGEQP